MFSVPCESHMSDQVVDWWEHHEQNQNNCLFVFLGLDGGCCCVSNIFAGFWDVIGKSYLMSPLALGTRLLTVGPIPACLPNLLAVFFRCIWWPNVDYSINITTIKFRLPQSNRTLWFYVPFTSSSTIYLSCLWYHITYECGCLARDPAKAL